MYVYLRQMVSLFWVWWACVTVGGCWLLWVVKVCWLWREVDLEFYGWVEVLLTLEQFI